MFIIVYKDEFLEKVALFPADSGVSMAADHNMLLVTSFVHGVSLKVTAYVIRPGQRFIAAERWCSIVEDVRTTNDEMVNIKLK